MKFSEMTYTRPDPEAVKATLAGLTERRKAARNYQEAREIFLSQQAESRHIHTAATLASVRHSIDTRDAYYDAEEKFWNIFFPELQAVPCRRRTSRPRPLKRFWPPPRSPLRAGSTPSPS